MWDGEWEAGLRPAALSPPKLHPSGSRGGRVICSGSSASAESCGSPGSLGQGASHALRSQEGVGDLGLNDGPAVLAKQGSLGLLGNVLRNPAELQLQR